MVYFFEPGVSDLENIYFIPIATCLPMHGIL